MGMGYFEKVEIAAVGADALNEKDVQIRVQEKEGRYNFRVGAGASDVNSLFGMAELSTDNFDIMNPGNWFYGGGQRLRNFSQAAQEKAVSKTACPAGQDLL